MDSRTAAHVLRRIAAYLELKGENRFKTRAYLGAAKGLLAARRPTTSGRSTSRVRSRPFAASDRRRSPSFAISWKPASRATSSSCASRCPRGCWRCSTCPRCRRPRSGLSTASLASRRSKQLEAAARDGRLARLPKFGPKTAEKVLRGIAAARERGTMRLYHHAVVDANQLLAAVRAHPRVTRAEIAGAIRRRLEVAAEIEIVAACDGDPVDVAQSWTRVPGVRQSEGKGASVSVGFVDGAHLRLHCVRPTQFGAGCGWPPAMPITCAASSSGLRRAVSRRRETASPPLTARRWR